MDDDGTDSLTLCLIPSIYENACIENVDASTSGSKIIGLQNSIEYIVVK